jgi:hypothetical protein
MSFFSTLFNVITNGFTVEKYVSRCLNLLKLVTFSKDQQRWKQEWWMEKQLSKDYGPQ